jgi:hypothetical protein
VAPVAEGAALSAAAAAAAATAGAVAVTAVGNMPVAARDGLSHETDQSVQ